MHPYNTECIKPKKDKQWSFGMQIHINATIDCCVSYWRETNGLVDYADALTENTSIARIFRIAEKYHYKLFSVRILSENTFLVIKLPIRFS